LDLQLCYDGIKRIAPYIDLDSFEVVTEVERYREFWKPERPRVILLAESHVHTRKEDFVYRWSYPDVPELQGNFVRFVYCLANGERDLVNIASNRGTWQYWKILSSCLNGESSFPAILKRSTPNFKRRIENKILLLKKLKEAGVWLLDGSIVGINGLAGTVQTDILLYCWKEYTGPRVKSLSPPPKHMIVIGSGVDRTLRGEIDKLGIPHSTIPQPNARLEGGYSSKFYQTCFRICSESRKPRS
jgi:hypothetical protein